MKVESIELEQMKTEFPNMDTIDLNNSSHVKIDHCTDKKAGEFISCNATNIKQEDTVIDISSESNDIYPSNLKTLHQEVNLNQNEDPFSSLNKFSQTSGPKLGTNPRKRRKRTTLSKSEERALRQEKLKSDHPVRPPCVNCRLKCTERITYQTRVRINREFWSLHGLINRRSFVIKHVKRIEIKRRRTGLSFKKRNNVFNYYLQDDHGEELQVCKIFFLTTLGFKSRNDGILSNVLQSINNQTQEPKMDMRGKIRNQDKMQSRRKAIHQHVESFHPFISHIRRDDLPPKRYLPIDLTIKEMHADFIIKYPAFRSSSYTIYRTLLTEMNVSFAKLGSEECDMCETFNRHDPSHSKNNLSSDCDICYKWSIHIKRAFEAKEMYQQHIAEMSFNTETVYFTADLQKPVLLPKLFPIKLALFTRKLLAFNKTFVPLGSAENNTRPIVIIWHEAVAGRKEEDIISVYYQFFLECRDKKRVVLWLDNSFDYNKNWTLLTFLVYIVNSNDVEIESVEIFYFETGHTYMSTDSFYHLVETSIKRKAEIYDFKDFENAIRQTNVRNFVVKSMTRWDFRDFKDQASPQKLKTLISKPLMNDIKYLKAVRKSYTLQFRMNYDENVELAELDFLSAKVIKLGFSRPQIIGTYRGIPESKKKEIIETLVKHMPPSRRNFWYDLPEGDVLDLIDNND